MHVNMPLAGGAVAAVLMCGGGAAAIAATTSHSTRGSRYAPGEAKRELARVGARNLHNNTHVNSALRSHFAILRAGQAVAHSAADLSTVNAALAGVSQLGGGFGVDPSQAAETLVGSAQDPAYIVPGSSGACLVVTEASGQTGGTCASTSRVDSGSMWFNDVIPYGPNGAPTRVLLGAVPNGISSVAVNWSDGGSTSVPVVDNFYVTPIASHQGWTSVTMKNASGQTTTIPGMSTLPAS